MTIDEAIKILTCKANEFWDKDAQREADACQLGIEALKRELQSRGVQTVWEIRKLPGETEE